MIAIRYGEDSEQIKIDAFYIVSLLLPDSLVITPEGKAIGFLQDMPIAVIEKEEFCKGVSLLNNSGYETVENHSIRRLIRNVQNPEVSYPRHFNRAYWQTSSHLCGGNRRDLRWLYASSHLNTLPYNLRRNNTEKLDVEYLHRFLREDVIGL